MPLPAARVRARVLMETLEPRILYSADLAAVAAMAGGDAGLAQEQRLQNTAQATAQTTTQTADQTAVRTEIAFVDLGLPEARTLVDGLLAERAAGRPIEVVTIAADQDGLAVISRTLDERQAAGETFDAVHVFSHGQSGVVALGTSTLDADSLLRRAGEIAGWGSALSAQADLMLYGCDVAAGANGLFLIEGLAALTGADVAASDDLTGSAARGGDWLLEQHTGQIEAAVAADAALQQSWDGVLGSERQVNLTTAGNQNTDAETRGSQQAVTLDAAGNYTVVWTSGGQDGGGKGVYVRRFAYDGTALTGEILVNTTTAKDQKNARIVGDASGQFAVVWTSQDQDGTTASVYFRRFAANGTALTGEIRANASDSGDQLNAVIGLNSGNGDLVVAWEGDGPGGQSVFFRRFAQDGSALDATDRAAGTLNGELSPAVAMDATGRFVIAWNDGLHIRFQRYDATGAAAGAITQVDNVLSESAGASIAMDSTGNFTLAYTETKTLKGIWGRAYHADGSSRGTWFYVDSATDATSPSISLAPDGTAVVVYQKGGDGGGKGSYARVVNADGTFPSGGAAFLVNQTTSGDQLSASVAVHDASHYVVAWSGEGAVDNLAVSVRTFEPANTAPQITSDGGGATAAVSIPENTTAVTTVHATDADWPVQALVYAITGGADQAKFAIDSQSGALTFLTPPNFELPADVGGNNVYNVVVSASDGQLSSAQALAVTVTNVLVNDQVSAKPDQVSIAYQTATSVNVLANDLLGTGPALTLLDLVQPTHGTAAISAGQVLYTPDAGYVGSDTLQYRVIDNSEGLAGYWALDDNVGANAGEPSPVAGVHGQALQFNGVDDRVALAGVSYTQEFTLSYWFKLADNVGTGYHYLYADGASGAQNSLNVYFIEDATVTGSGIQNVLRTVLVDSNDGTAIANTSALDITATGLADNRWHQYTLTTVTGTGSFVYIDGTLRASSSQGGDTLTTNGAVLLGASSTLSATRFLTGALDDVALYHHTTPASSVAALASGPGDIGTVTLDVVPANTQTPVITSGGGGAVATVSLAENLTAATVVTAYDTDAGGPALTYSIIGGADQARFTMDAASGAVSFRTAPNFEQPTDTGADNVYDLTVQVSDGVHVDTQQLRLVVTDANEYGLSPITDADPAAEALDENAAIGTLVGFTASAFDADGTTNTVTYSLDISAGGLFAIDASTGVLRLAGTLNAEAATSHTLVVRAASIDGSNQTLQVTVTVRDLNEASVTTPFDADWAPNTVSETAAIGSTVGITASALDADATNNAVTYTLTDNAGGRFAIGASSGVVTVDSALDAEVALSHTIVVQATSADGSVANQSFTIAVQDVNEFSVTPITDLDSAAESVREDAAIGTAIGFQAHAVDADATSSTVVYSLDYAAEGRFAIDASTGVVTVAGLLNAETATSHILIVRAASGYGSSQTLQFTVAVRDLNEASVTAPFDADGAPNTVSESAAIGSAVGLTASAVDTDATNNAVTYTLTDNAGGRFSIDSSSGVVKVASALDAEVALSHTVVVQATSADGSVANQSFTIAVQDVNEFGVTPITDLDSAAESVREDAAIGTAIGFQARAVDADATSSTVVYSLDYAAEGRFAIDANTGVVTVAGLLNAETATSHILIVRAASGYGSSQTLQFTVAVRDLDEASVTTPFDADGASNTVSEGAAIGSTVGITASAVDADATNNAVTYALTDNAGGRFAIDSSSGVVTVDSALDAEVALSHTVVVQATSADGSVASQSFTIAVQDVNESGVSAITDLDSAAESVREDAVIGTAIGFQARAVDPDATNSAVTYTLLDNAGGRFSIGAGTGVLTVVSALDAEVAPSHTVVVQATSADGSLTTRSVTIAVQDVNEFNVSTPVDADTATNAVNDNATTNTRVGITAFAGDPDISPDQITYALADDAGGRFAIDSTTGVVTLARSVLADSGSTLNLVLQATSSDGSVATQAMAVVVSPTNLYAPVITSNGGGASAALSVAENTSGLVTTLVATDADVSGVPLSYQITGGADAARFTLDAATGALRFLAAPDAEAALDAGADNQYDVVVQASDGVLVDTQALRVTVLDVNELAISAITDLDPAADAVQENAAIGTVVGAQVLAVDGDATNSTVTYSLDDTAGGRFAIGASSGVVTVAGLLDAETALSHTILVRAASSDGSATTLALTIAVQDVNEYGVSAISDADARANSVREDDPVGTTVGVTVLAQDLDATTNAVRYSLDDNAGGRFAINASTGVVTIAQVLDAETALNHSIVVRAVSSDGNATTLALTIAVQDVNEYGVSAITDSNAQANSVREDDPVGTVVGLTALAQDLDATANAVTYSLSDNAGGRFDIDANTGVVTIARALDAETAQSHSIVVRALSADGSVQLQTFSIAVRDVDEFDLVAISDLDASPDTVAENAAIGTQVGFTAQSVDADVSNNTVSYSLDDTAGGRFAIDASSGVVTVAGLLDAETALNHSIVVRAVSSDGSATTLSLTIAVQDVNEYGVSAISDADARANSVREDDPVGTVVGLTALAQDRDATSSTVAYALADDAGGRFFIDASTGVVTIARALDAETAQSHSIVVRALSVDGSVQLQTFGIAVRDVDEFDLLAISDVDGAANVVAENAAVGTRVGITAQSVDADVTNNTVTYALLDSAGGRFAIDAASGVVTVAGPLDAETALAHTIVVQATSSDNSQWTQAYTVAVTDVDEFDLAAVSDTDGAADAVAENAAVGTRVGLTAQSVDADVTNHTVTYALLDSAGGRFAIDAATGVVTVAGALDAETALSHTLVVQATSADGSVWAQAFTVQVTDVDEFDLVAVNDADGAADTVAENAAAGTPVGLTARSVDADATSSTVTYALADNAGGRFAIDATTGVITVAGALDAETAMAHTLVVQATSADGSLWTQAFTVRVTDVDEFDLVAVNDADASPSVLPENAAAGTLAGITAHAVDADATNNSVTYTLADSAGGRFAIDAGTGVVTLAGTLDAETALSHTLVVQATSADGSLWTQAFTVQVTDVDEFDLVAVDDADATRNAVAENAAVGTAVGLRASSVDADLTTNAITYSLDDSAGGRFAVDAATGVVTLARAVPDEGVATRTVVLRATSADGSTVAASFAIAVLPVNEQAPVIDSDGGGAGAALAVDEGQTAVTQVLAHDNDLPADTLRYTVSGGADAALFTVDAVTGVLRFAAAPDAEAPRDQGADNLYEVSVQVSDGLYTDEQALRITVQPLNDTAPVITSDGGGATAVRHVAENTLAVTQVQARDADLPADTLTYAVSGGADAALFAVDATTGALRWRAAPDRETPRDAGADGVYDVTVRVSDGLHTASQSLAVVVDNVDEAPRLDTNALAILEGGTARPVLLASDVDTPAAALVYTVQDLTGGRFEQTTAPGVAVTRFTQAEVDAGAIRFVADGNEAAPSYRLTLADATTTLAPQAAQVAFTPVNDAPVSAAVDLGTVDEDTARVITTADLLVGASDAEGDALSVSTLRLTGGEGTLVDLGGGRWRFDPAADWHGAVTLAGEVSDGQAGVALVAALQVQAVNDAPRITSSGGAATVALDQAENTIEVTTLVGADVDADAPLHYAVVGGADAARFQIDAATGVLSFRQAPDHEQPADANGDNRYDVRVEVSDGALTAQQALQITVSNVDEAPVVTRNVALISDGKVTLVLHASDQDTPATALTYRVDSVQGGQFELATAPGQAVTVFTQADLDAARVTWVAPVGSTATAFALRLSDGQSEVRIGAPTQQRQAAPAVEMTLAAVAAGDASAATSAGDSAATTTTTPVAAAARRTDPVLPPPADSVGDDGALGPRPRTDEDAGSARGGGVRPAAVEAPVVRSPAARAAAAAEPPAAAALDLPSEGGEAPKRLVAYADLWGSRSGTSLAEQMDRLRQEVADAQQAGMVSLASTALVSTGLSVGYVIWLVRGGVLMTSLMSVVPAWAGMDPLPVLAEMRRHPSGTASADGVGDGDDGGDDGGDDPIEKLFSKARRLLVRPAAGPSAAPELPERSA
ncbi:cadherin domain-containing protein [uncultured Sphaerotilus sp.]|uniref:cadherin domain-containing protein n=1 Tax=uncultured Sphaerotilus sp. TaxID=474984 RepID=UPI0030CA2F33